MIKDIEMIDYIFSSDSSKNFNAIRISLGNCMYENVGIIRDELSLIKAFDYIKYLRTQSYSLHCINKEKRNNVELSSILELRNALEISEGIILSASLRKESRGSHFRKDFPTLNEKYNKHILISEFQKGFFKLEFEEDDFWSKIRNLIINKK